MTSHQRWWESLKRFGIKPGLSRTAALMDRLGHPEQAFSAVHVAGTNGKGSTAAMIAAGLRAHGLLVGLTTSPDLGQVRERVAIDGEIISPDDWEALRAEVAEAGRNLIEPPTEFEALTALAFLAFARRGVTMGVVEVGLGGRYDATNILPPPMMTVLTPIALDHQEILGATLTDIAWDKCGIIKAGSRVVAAWQAPPVRAVIKACASERGVMVRWARARDIAADAAGVTVRVGSDVVRVGLLGRHQGQNLATAWTALQWLREHQRWDSSRAQKALQSLTWPGRLEKVSEQPLIFLDAAHNAHGTRALARTLAEPYMRKPWHLIFGTLRDKPGTKMLKMLLPHVQSVILLRPENGRALDPERLAHQVPSTYAPVVASNSQEALTLACQRASRTGAVLAAGSFYVVGPIRQILIPPGSVPRPLHPSAQR